MRLFAERGVTQVTVSDLAEAAGVARGTVYNNLQTTDSLFEEVATRLTTEMGQRIAASSAVASDPARRLADGLRFFVRRAHEDPVWGRFLVRFAVTTPTLRELLQGPPTSDLHAGIDEGRFALDHEQVLSAVAVLSAAALAAMSLVLEGHRTWRDAGSDAAELVLRGLGLPREEAQSIAHSVLPPLAPVHD